MTKSVLFFCAAAVLSCGTALDVLAQADTPQDQPMSITIPMPQGSVPEGIAIKDGIAFVSSISQGTVYRIDLESGEPEVLKEGSGHSSLGLLIDEQDRLFVAGGRGGTVEVVDAKSGEVLASYKVADAEETFINDLDRLGDAIYATDSFAPVVYKLPLGEDGDLPEEEDVERISLSGVTYEEGFNANGITQTPDESALLIVKMNTGDLLRVDPTSGAAEVVDTGDVDLTGGDGLLREGNILYVVRNMANRVAVLELDDAATSASLKDELTDPGFDTPTTVARFEKRLYLPNARFTVEDPENAEFSVIGIHYEP